MSLALIDIADEHLPQTNIKLVFFDIDGTLLNRDGCYTIATQQAIQRIQAKGIKTAIASGRPHFATTFLVDELKLDAPGVFCTGAQIYDPAQRLTLAANTIAPDLALQLLTEIRALNIYYELYTANNFFIERDFASDIRRTHAQHLRCEPQVRKFDDIIEQQPIFKMLIGADQGIDSASLQYLEKRFPQLIFAYAGLPAYPQWLFASIIDKNANKLTAFNRLLQHHGIAAENVMSFGDAHSDMTFIQAAGLGIAMGNGSEAVKAVANYVTRPVWDDGIAYALERLIP